MTPPLNKLCEGSSVYWSHRITAAKFQGHESKLSLRAGTLSHCVVSLDIYCVIRPNPQQALPPWSESRHTRQPMAHTKVEIRATKQICTIMLPPPLKNT